VAGALRRGKQDVNCADLSLDRSGYECFALVSVEFCIGEVVAVGFLRKIPYVDRCYYLNTSHLGTATAPASATKQIESLEQKMHSSQLGPHLMPGYQARLQEARQGTRGVNSF
jgi:hypothetical protein